MHAASSPNITPSTLYGMLLDSESEHAIALMALAVDTSRQEEDALAITIRVTTVRRIHQ